MSFYRLILNPIVAFFVCLLILIPVVINILPIAVSSEYDSSSRQHPEITFTNVTAEVGLAGVRGDSYAWGDYNNDGYQDLLVKGSRLFRNNGPPVWDFTEVTELVGLDSSGYAVWGDYNNDGCLDFYSAGNPETGSTDNPDGSMDTLWRNNGPPSWTFTNATAEAGNPDDGYPSLAAGWGDYDRDGFIDLYVVNWRDLNDVRYPDKLWHNNGDGTFSDVTVEAGIDDYTEPFAGMGVNWGDYNDDGWIDIYVSNYLLTPNFLWHNNGDGTFINVAFEKGVTGEESRRGIERYYGHTAGSSWADFDNDGDLDLWQSNLAHKDLYRAGICADSELLRNNGPASDYTFTNIRSETGIPTQPPGGDEELFFGVAWGDYDNDGDLDLWVPQIKSYIDYAYSYFFRNNGDGTFTDVSEEANLRVWDSDGGCFCDYNNDGWLDLITEGKYPYENGTYEVRLYRNNGADAFSQLERNWLSIDLNGVLSNRAAIGARVYVTDETGRTQLREVEGGTAGHSYQHSLCLEFGFEDYSGEVEVKIRWPTGKIQKLSNVQLNKIIEIKEPYAYPDMVVAELWASNPKPEEGNKVTLFANVENWGSEPSKSGRVRFFDGPVPESRSSRDLTPVQIGEAQMIQREIQPGESYKASVVWDTSGELGAHTLWAQIDQVTPEESNENNNIRVLELTVSKPNTPPQPHLTATPETVELADATVEFDASGSTDDGEIVEYYFDFGDSENSDWIEEPIVSHTYKKTGEYFASVILKDDKDVVSETQASIKITVTESYVNTPPVIQQIIFDTDPAYAGEKTMIYIEAEDSNNDIVEYIYSVTGGTITGSGSSVSWLAPEQPGDYTLEITVIDSVGNVDRDTYEIIVIPVPVHLMKDLSISAHVIPANVRADGMQKVVITAEIYWNKPDSGSVIKVSGSNIKRFTADLSSLGGRSDALLYDSGKSGDEYADDGVYSAEFVVAKSAPDGLATILLTAHLADDRELSATTGLMIEPAKEDKIEEGPGERLGLPGFEAFAVIIAMMAIAIIEYRRKR